MDECGWFNDKRGNCILDRGHSGDHVWQNSVSIPELLMSLRRSSALDHERVAATQIERLRDLIVRMALDGYSALSPSEKNAIAEIVNSVRS